MTVLLLGLPGWAGAWWVLGLDLTAFKRCVALGFGVVGPCAWGASVHLGGGGAVPPCTPPQAGSGGCWLQFCGGALGHL